MLHPNCLQENPAVRDQAPVSQGQPLPLATLGLHKCLPPLSPDHPQGVPKPWELCGTFSPVASMSPLSGKELQNSGVPREICPGWGMLWGEAASTHSVSSPGAPPWDPSPQVGAGQVGEEAQWGRGGPAHGACGRRSCGPWSKPGKPVQGRSLTKSSMGSSRRPVLGPSA